MTEKEKKRMLDRAAKLKPKPILTPSGSWRCQFRADGKRQSVTASTPEEAHAQAIAIQAGFLQLRRDPGSLTVEQAIDRYIESKDAILSPSTINGYRKIKASHVDAIKDIPIGTLTQQKVQRWVNELARQHAPKTVRNAHGLISAVLAAYRPEFVLRTTLPQKDPKRIDIPTEEEMRIILSACVGTPLELPLLLAVWLGLRASEIRGLKFEDVKDGRLHVCRAIVEGPDGPEVKRTKTVSGDRWIKLPRYLLELIERQPQKSEYIVSLSGQAMYKRFSRLCDQLNVPHYRFHDLRHMAASVSLFLGVPDKYSQQRMGHKTTNMLKTVYQHTVQEKEDEYADRINAYYEGIFAL